MEEEIDNDAVIDLTDNNQLAPEALEDQQDADNLNNVDYLQDVDEIIREAENGEGVEAPEHVENGVEHGEDDSAEKNDEEEQVEEENNPFADDDDSDDEGGGVQVTIRKLEPTEKPAARQGKLDLDATPMINDKPIYDQDLATMEDRPWRKPGADITDYFNYGFTEETWNLYCERQKKLRIEFGGNQQAANNALLAGIKVTNPLANPVINSSSSVVKVLTDNGGRFKQPHQQTNTIQNEQVIRTVISGTTQPTSSMMDFSRPPPGMTMPPMGVPVVPIQSAPPTSVAEAPPGIDTTSDLPPGVESAPGVSAPAPFGGGLDLNLGLPPLGFNPNLPPPGLPPMGMMSAGLPPPGFSMPPPQFQVGQHSRAGFGPGPVATQPRGLMGSSSFGNLSDDDDERRSSRRKRSRSRSPRRDRDREDRRDRDSRRRSDRDADRSRRHRSRSTSGDRRRRRDDREREKRRERRDDEDRKKRSRRDDDDDSRRKEKSSKPKEDEEPTGTSGTGNEESPVVE
ncbi:hypothetical protein CAEBREN_20190 [Caenorhabditis brenneri]|uniref:Pre-mRNA polyadenylation factor Fip1 domain-containing protein n=1 Tax=Caenorhabditis brenneri TaxID=135651 RepID=G0MTG6_CAEBE|nr:hypothetical protein CAEBREN_20190 [Caenorhabditis brenneri]